uniref:WPK1 n=1 Tax=Arundo donax TaxID=35708 RepID=A0A0A9DD33_ARUDO
MIFHGKQNAKSFEMRCSLDEMNQSGALPSPAAPLAGSPALSRYIERMDALRALDSGMSLRQWPLPILPLGGLHQQQGKGR